MPLIAGTCVIGPGGVVTGVGLAKAIADACVTPNPPGSTTESCLQQFSNLLAAAIVEHIVTFGLVNVPPGVLVQVAVPAGTGATVAPGIGTIT